MVALEGVSYRGLRARPEAGRFCPHLPPFPGGRGLHREARGAMLYAVGYAKLCAAMCGHVRLHAAMCGFWGNEARPRPDGQKLFLRPDCDRESPHRAIGRLRSLSFASARLVVAGTRCEADRHGKSGFFSAFRRLAGGKHRTPEKCSRKRRSHQLLALNMQKSSQTTGYEELRLIDLSCGFP